MTDRLKVSYTRDEPTPPNLFTDHDWVRHNQEALREKYGERVIVVYKEQVLGVGDTYQEAIDDAAQHLPPGTDVVTPMVEFLARRSPLFRASPSA